MTKRQKDGRIVIIELRSRVRFIEKKAYLRDHDYLPETIRFTISTEKERNNKDTLKIISDRLQEFQNLEKK